MKLLIPEYILDDILKDAMRSYPREICGVLLGNTDGMLYRVNLAEKLMQGRGEEGYFLMDLNEWMGCIMRARKQGLSYIGMYHSHPNGSPMPSSVDMHRMLECPGEIWLIVAVEKGLASYAAYVAPTSSSAIIRVPVEVL
ncbi:MAG: hypothetical protein DRN15_04155 [Thermoprotei archaeon]|nr:MAG: hypothetical protein DRN15_04155 [Thermoprotei archaeon]RLF25954.1 MAG: hypothetical protein DRM97_00155 [Thermoprotei archaeon]